MDTSLYKTFSEIQNRHWWFRARKEIVLDVINTYIERDENFNCLDIGCGSGYILNDLSKLGVTYGIDVSDEAVFFSSKIFNGVIRKGLLPDDIPFNENIFNLITVLDVIEHIEKDIESLHKIYSLLLPGGAVVLTVPAFMFLWSSFDDINEHKRRYTLTELSSKLSTAGFIVEKISYFNTFLFPLIWTARTMARVAKRKEVGEIIIPNVLVNILLENIFKFEKYFLKHCSLPFGVSIIAVGRKCITSKCKN